MMWRYYDRLEEACASLLLASTAIAMLASATMRALGSPFAGGSELAQFLFIWTAVVGADIALKHGGQVRVSALVSLLPGRLAWSLTAFCLLLIAGFLVCLIWYGFPLALRNWQRPMGVGTLSYGYVTLALPVGACLMLLTIVRRTISHGVLRSLQPDDDHQEAETAL